MATFSSKVLDCSVQTDQHLTFEGFDSQNEGNIPENRLEDPSLAERVIIGGDVRCTCWTDIGTQSTPLDSMF